MRGEGRVGDEAVEVDGKDEVGFGEKRKSSSRAVRLAAFGRTTNHLSLHF